MDAEPITRKDFEQLQAQITASMTLAQENNRLLLSMRKWGRIAFWFKVVIWTLVLVAPVILFPYIARYLQSIPGLQSIEGSSAGASSSASSLFGLPSPSEIQQFLHESHS